VLAAAVAAERILEVGCGLGYSALSLAQGSDGRVETIERDGEHARLAEETIAREGYGDRIRVLRGRGADVLPGLAGPYDLIFSDGDPEEMPLDLDHFFRLLRPGGLIVSSNLFLAQFVRELPGIEQIAEYRQRLLDDGRLLTAIVPGGLAVSVVRPAPHAIK
jgi:predicted O-methyltransferase YrrM